MPAINVTPDISGHTANNEVATGCAVCPHPWTAHDQIAARFCNATATGKFSRGCVCTAYPEDTAHKSD